MRTESERWKILADRLGIETIAPFTAQLGGMRVVFAALLPQFGGTAGMVADPDWSAIEPFVDALLYAGYGFSAVELGDDNDEATACEMLRDWGWSVTDEKPDGL